jgi:hypothetical protein
LRKGSAVKETALLNMADSVEPWEQHQTMEDTSGEYRVYDHLCKHAFSDKATEWFRFLTEHCVKRDGNGKLRMNGVTVAEIKKELEDDNPSQDIIDAERNRAWRARKAELGEILTKIMDCISTPSKSRWMTMEHNLTKLVLLATLGYGEHPIETLVLFVGYIIAVSPLHICSSYLYRGTGNFLSEAERRGSLKQAGGVFADGDAMDAIMKNVELAPHIMRMIQYEFTDPEQLEFFSSCVMLSGMGACAECGSGGV